MQDKADEERAKMLCATVNDLLDYKAPAPLRSAAVLRRCVTDREQLRQIDYYVARLLSEAMAGKKGVRTFGEVSYGELRRRYGLKSLCHMRNAWRKRKSEQTR